MFLGCVSKTFLFVVAHTLCYKEKMDLGKK